jgi:nucleotide-binding universal stress UspA family protein
MSVKVIVSYDGTANEDDAIALGRLFGRAGAEVSLAYVRHAHEADASREQAVEAQAHGLLQGGVELLGDANAKLHVVTDRSTPEGLGRLAAAEGADVIVFCSDSHTAKGHVSVGNSAERLLEGSASAIAIAPVDVAERVDAGAVKNIVAVGDADGGARETAEALASALGASVAPVLGEQTDLLVIDSRAGAQQGRVSLSSSASHLIEIATCPVLVLPRGVKLAFSGAGTTAAA